MKRILLTIFIILILLLPALSFAALELEQIYPEFSQEITLTGRSSLVSIIKYYSTWAIIIAILATIVSLIIGGIGYLTSAGRPQAMTAARKRIAKSFLGLAILTSSYLILKVVNPQLNLLRIKKIPITSGIVALTSCAIEGYIDEATSGGVCNESMEDKGLLSGTPASLKELIDLGQARYLSNQITDMTGTGGFGRMVAVEHDMNGNPEEINFEDFPLYALGFWGDAAQNIKVKTYSEKNMFWILNEYTVDGKINWDWEVERGSFPTNGTPEMDVVIIKDDFVVSKVDFIDPKAVPPDPSKHSKAFLHPPLSIAMEGIGPGVYLYSETSQRYFISGFDDFSFSDFDDKAVDIEIKNTDPRPDVLAEKHDYLAILYDDAQYRGSFRLFFQKRAKRFVPVLYWEEDDFYSDVRITKNTNETVDLDDLKSKGDIWNDALGAGAGHFRGTYALRPPHTAGNVPESKPDNPENSKININEVDQYGKVNGASSIQIFEIGKQPACREVRLCNRKFGMGYCISYTNFGLLKKGLYKTFNLPMPWYAPVNLPGVIKGTVQIREENGERTKLLKPGSGNVWQNIEVEPLMFKRNIKSIIIDGNCLVALFKNPVEDLRECFTPPGDTDKCWKKGTPDVNSEIFTETDADLTDNLIGICAARDVGRFNIGKIAPCAAAIAVFPIK